MTKDKEIFIYLMNDLKKSFIELREVSKKLYAEAEEFRDKKDTTKALVASAKSLGIDESCELLINLIDQYEPFEDELIKTLYYETIS